MKKYKVHPIDDKTFAIEEKTMVNQGLCYLICGTKKSLLIDTGLGYDGLKETVESLTDLPVVVANTHGHVDHIGGNHLFREIWLHEADKEIFKKHLNPKYTLKLLVGDAAKPVEMVMKLITKKLLQIDSSGNYHYFGDDKVFDLGERQIEVIPTPGHTPGSVCFLDRQSRQLFSGDSVCEWGVLLHFTGEGCPPAVYENSMERLQGLEDTFDTIWPGHHGFPVDKQYIEEYRSCAGQIENGTAVYGDTKGRRCAKYGRILITVPETTGKGAEK